jgi:hypothetical protein
MNLLKDKSSEKELYKESIFIELSERLEMEMNDKNISATELSKLLGKEESYINMILEGMVDVKLSELAYIFAFFDKFIGIIPISKHERIKIIKQ